MTPAPLLQRSGATPYGSRTEMLLSGDGLGDAVAPGLHEGELRYLHEHEWARSADDVLWRRTKLGLHLSETERAAVARWCEAHWPAPANARSPSERAWS
jgi:glycerol-3-phosphate dehydrogenase